ncbi:MAG: tetratricopeptide repeat protein [Chroococcus sp. CMT-3BRIN-NPC107]|jgi:tetratricopeptide (TPR) repeat protein|nr:tetratricopeptide repeat protein [Chroococcus sp. CMT-3BRIN-NPC107]
MYLNINKFSKSIIAITLILSCSSLLLINSNNSSVQAQINLNSSSSWQEFTAKAGGFSILLPSKPREDIQPISEEADSGTLHNFFVDTKDGTYGVSYADFPNIPSNFNSQQIDELLKSVRDGVVGKGKLLKERRITLNGYVGKEIEFVDLNKLNYKVRIYFIKRRLYQQIVVSANPKLIVAQATNRFLDSFKLIASQIPQAKEPPAAREDSAVAPLAPISRDPLQETPNTRENSNLATLAQTGREQLQKGEFKAALTTLQQALAIARRSNNKPIVSTLLNNIGEAYRGQSNYVQALDFYQQALTITRELKDKAGEGLILTNIGSVYQGQSNYSQALKFAELGLAIHKETGNRALAGTTLNNIGLIYYSRGDYAPALVFLQEALAIHKETKNRAEEGTTLNNIGLVYTSQGQYAQALETYQQALILHQAVGNKSIVGTTLNNIGLIYYSRSQYFQALDSFQQAVKISREFGNRSLEAISLNNIGLAYTATGEYAQALAAYQPAIEIARAIGDKSAVAQLLISIGLVYANQSQYAQALSSYQQGLEVAKEIGDKAIEVNIVYGIGDIYLNQSQYAQALDSYKQALILAKALGNPAIEGQIFGGMGLVYTYRGEYTQALEAFKQGLVIYKKVGSPAGESRTLNNIGLVYQGQSRYAEAIAIYEQSLKIVKQIGDKAGESVTLGNIGLLYESIGQYEQSLKSLQEALKISQSIGNRSSEGTILTNIGNVYLRYDAYDRALNTYEQALTILQKVGNRAGVGTLFNNIGEVNRRQGQYAKAIASYEKGLVITREVGNRAIEGTTLNNIGEVSRLQGNFDQALKLYQQALTILQQVNNKSGEGQTLTNIGFTLFKAGKLEAAQQTLEKAIATSESVRPGLSDANKVSIFDTQAGIYSILQQILVGRNQPEAALETSERGRARAFLELLAKKVAPQSAESVPLPNINQIRQIAQQQKATLVEYSLIVDEFKVEGKTQLKESELYIWVVKPTGEVIFRRSDLKPLWQQKNNSLSNLVNNSRQAIPGRSRGSLQQLHQLLIQPIADQLPTNPSARVVFIPQGSLFLVPFPALQQANGKYLIERHTILTSPSIQLLAVTHGRRMTASNQNRGAMVVGNPTMPKVSPELGLPPVQLPNLPAAEIEANAIAPLLKTQAITGGNATKAAIVAKLPSSRIVHLATHGLLDDVRGLGSAIALAPSGKDNGLFTAEEILDLKLNADLVVMSACNTGRGQITGDGIIGLSRSWISAGVSSVIVSLWLVPDESTSTLMTNFYQNMQKDSDKAQALRQAMLTTMKQNPNPRDWAAFTLIGEAE